MGELWFLWVKLCIYFQLLGMGRKGEKQVPKSVQCLKIMSTGPSHCHQQEFLKLHLKMNPQERPLN